MCNIQDNRWNVNSFQGSKLERSSHLREMTPNSLWNMEEKGTVLTTSRFERFRKRRLVLSLLAFAISVLAVVAAAGVIIYYYYSPQVKKTSVFETDPCHTLLCVYGSRCLVDATTRRAYCRCDDSACSDVFAPVCGDDGATYSSECQLRLAACMQQRRIFVLRQGPCDVRDPCETTECRFGSYCSPSLDGGSARCVCPEGCDGGEGGPVCGSDGRNYPSACHLRKASCRQMRSIEVKFQGVCDPCEGVECPTSQLCQLDEGRNPICRCNAVCSPDFRPVCGSDGKTYPNECALRVESCRSRRPTRIIYTGECSGGANPCDSLQCSPYQQCEIDGYGKAACLCEEEACEAAVRPVCGSDGRTHLNECEMRRHGCQVARRLIKLAYRGECGERGACYQYHCDFGALCVLRAGAPTCECPACTEEFEPVCGTDGISYTNDCKLRRESCEQKSDIAVAYSGLCNGCENKRCEYYAVCESDGRGSGKCVCPKTCIKVDSPVCGTDEVTYPNECEMRVAACRKAQYVMVVSKGPCDLCRGVHCKYGARCEGGRCVCPTECPGALAAEAVCANDGVTYANECEMRQAACRHDQELNVLFYGECEEAGESHDEGSGSELMDCEERTCRFGGECEYDAEGVPHCACDFRCPQALDPVCGSDGSLHDNPCRLKEEACRRQKSVMPVHIEMCEEVREVPCAGETPLVDPSSGKDYFCGEGMGSKRCPPGSYCHKSSAFSKCCREIILIKTCSESTYGCCPDGKTAAQGPHNAGCPSVCNCNRLGSYGLTCDPVTKQCFCKPGVGGPRCDRCEPGYWGLHKITDENSGGCSPCTCTLYGSARDDCEQMTGRCVCKFGIKGMKCDLCPPGTVLGPDGCMDESIAQPVSGSCDDLTCLHGATCRETEDGRAQCVCEAPCAPTEDGPVCGSDGTTYGSECQMRLFSCRYQKRIVEVSRTTCPKDIIRSGLKEFRRRRKLRNLERSHSLQKHSYNGTDYHLNPVSFLAQKNKTERKKQTIDGMELELWFTLSNSDGLLFNAENRKKNIFIILSVKKRFLELRFQGPSETTVLKSPIPVSLNSSHHVLLRFFPRFIVMYLDDRWVDMKVRREAFRISEELQSFHIGSRPFYLRRNKKQVTFANLSGCILNVKIHYGKSNPVDTQSSATSRPLQKYHGNFTTAINLPPTNQQIKSTSYPENIYAASAIDSNVTPVFTWVQENQGVLMEIQIILLEKKMKVKILVDEILHCEIPDIKNISINNKYSLKLIVFNKSIELFLDKDLKACSRMKDLGSNIKNDSSHSILAQTKTSITTPCKCASSTTIYESSVELAIPMTLDCETS